VLKAVVDAPCALQTTLAASDLFAMLQPNKSLTSLDLSRNLFQMPDGGLLSPISRFVGVPHLNPVLSCAVMDSFEPMLERNTTVDTPSLLAACARSSLIRRLLLYAFAQLKLLNLSGTVHASDATRAGLFAKVAAHPS
jgi:hypothetical protein